MKVVAITGYKPHELGIFKDDHPGVQYIQKAFRKQLLQLVDEGLEWVLISGQPGVELWCAEVVFDLQEELPQLQLGIVMPFEEHYKRWPEEKQEYFEMVLMQADFADTLSKRPYEAPWQFKNLNAWLVEKSDGLLVLHDEERKGTPDFLIAEGKKKQAQSSYEIITITPYDIQMIAEDEQLSNSDYWAQ
ncbi:DUF1273 domain-containing protein [Bacillus tianshenii]|nr:DUF1273 domain-containing protein [Bacillus tianshenii]